MTAPQGSSKSAGQLQADVMAEQGVQAAELTTVRSRAANWSKGIGALLIAALAFSLVRGRSDLTGLDPRWAIVVGVFLVSAVLVAAVAAALLFRASYGPLGPTTSPDHTESRRTMRALAWGLGLSCAAFALLLAAVAVTWYGPAADGPALRVIDAQGTDWCGTAVSSGGGAVVLQVSGQEIAVDLSSASMVSPVESCPIGP